MSRHGLRQQKQLAKKKAKRAEKRTHVARQHSDDPTIRLAQAASWPVFAALIPDTLWKKGIGNVVFARRMPDGHIALAAFLVDVQCLGVKNALWHVLSMSEYRDSLSKFERFGTLHPVAPEYLAKLLRDVVAYTQSFGFGPHPDYRHAAMLLAGIDPSLCSEQFTFGKDGKPFYIRGPHESLERAEEISRRIEAAGGHFVICMESDEFDDEGRTWHDLDEDSSDAEREP